MTESLFRGVCLVHHDNITLLITWQCFLGAHSQFRHPFLCCHCASHHLEQPLWQGGLSLATVGYLWEVWDSGITVIVTYLCHMPKGLWFWKTVWAFSFPEGWEPSVVRRKQNFGDFSDRDRGQKGIPGQPSTCCLTCCLFMLYTSAQWVMPLNKKKPELTNGTYEVPSRVIFFQ